MMENGNIEATKCILSKWPIWRHHVVGLLIVHVSCSFTILPQKKKNSIIDHEEHNISSFNYSLILTALKTKHDIYMIVIINLEFSLC